MHQKSRAYLVQNPLFAITEIIHFLYFLIWRLERVCMEEWAKIPAAVSANLGPHL